MTVAELQNESEDRALVRKVLNWVGFVAPLSVAMPSAITDEAGALIELPTGWEPIGLVTPDGMTFGRETEKDEIEALGHASPVRTDIVGVNRSVSFTSLEHGRRQMVEILLGQDLSEISPTQGGEIVIDEVDLPIGLERRLLFIGADKSGDEQFIIGRGFPLVTLAESGDEQWQREGAIEQEYTFDVFTDDDLGTPVRRYLGGPGAVKHAASLGYGA